MSATPTFLVTGAGGHFGRLAVEALLAAEPGKVIAASRDPAKLADLVAKGAETRRADFDDVASLDQAFAGVDRLLIVSTDALGVPGLRQRQHNAAIMAATRAGVGHIVYTSMPRPEPGSLVSFAPDHYESELALAKSGIPHTILRNSWYVENLFMSLPQTLASGKWYSSAGEGRIAHVARADAAEAAAAALRSAPGGRFDITGPTLRTTKEVAAIVAEVFAKPVEVIAVSDEQLAAGLAAAGLPAPMVELIVGLDANTRVGGIDVRSEALQKLTGKSPRTMREVLKANKDAMAH